VRDGETARFTLAFLRQCFLMRLCKLTWRNGVGQLSPVQIHWQVVSSCLLIKGTVMIEITNMAWAVVFSALGGIIGIALILAASFVLPRLIKRMTPNIDEDKEIARGNVAVAQYFGRIVGASIIGVSIVVAAAVLGGIIAALH